MFLINIIASYRDMDLNLLGKWTSIDDKYIINNFKDVSSEILILRTCNRFEIYIVPREDASEKIKNLFLRYGKARVLYDMDAVRHIIQVSAGMDSMIPGEQDIQRQVKEALNNSIKNNTSGKIINYIFMKALNISKLIRSSTKIGNGIVSIPQTSVRILETMALKGKVCLIGTGKVANSILKYLINNNYEITVFGRNEEKLKIIRDKYNVKTDLIKNIKDELSKFDAIISAISVNEPVLKKEDFNSVKPSIVIDLGNPRNIENLEDRYYIDLEYIKKYVDKNIIRRKEEMEKANNIISDKISTIDEKIKSMEIEELISNLFKKANSIKEEEIEESVKILGEGSREILEKYGNSLIKKIYSRMVTNLRKNGSKLTKDQFEILKKILGE
ncbi:MAG: NAD(P)-binding domain-containing protein [Thermoplasmata archaeon]|nr:NAD(P)-binding domain-containing protein [Thermoplasmata archaeon]